MLSMAEQPLADDANVLRRKLGIELRRRRETLNLKQQEAADLLEWSLSKLIRIESGTHGVSVGEIKSVIGAYQITDEQSAAELLAAARGSRGQAWWWNYRDIVSPAFARYLGHEGMAESFHIFHPFVVPGLLQTQEYATALVEALPIGDSVRRRLVELKLARQERLFAQPGLSFNFIVGEEALHRQIGGPRVMENQLEYLAKVSRRENVTFGIVPFSAGSYPGLLGQFIMLTLKENGELVLFQEDVSGDQIVRGDADIIAKYRKYSEDMLTLALRDMPAEKLLREQIDRLRHA
jgi:transcriptional regulator with XRE-family HTH domain